MNSRYRLFWAPRLAGALGLLGGCRHDVVVVPAAADYFPLAVGTYRTYAVTDSTWKNAVATVSTFQFRERVTEQFTDAAGQPAYRLVRSRRATAAATWVDDSVLVAQVLPQAVLLTRNNLRTVELVYPPRAGKAWNMFAFTVGPSEPDTITNLTRAYAPAVGTATTTPAAGGQPAKTYPATVATYTTLPNGVPDVNAFYQHGLQQVYALGVGLVQRRRFSYTTFVYVGTNGDTKLTPAVVQSGASRSETLVETGTL